nr:hypothetical protein HmN_000950300 [Hymenolepis microstoma]CUU98037.1 hypothetical transcript [Hymenolepis microstoma]
MKVQLLVSQKKVVARSFILSNSSVSTISSRFSQMNQSEMYLNTSDHHPPRNPETPLHQTNHRPIRGF